MKLKLSPVRLYTYIVLMIFTLLSLTPITQLIATGGAVQEATGDIYVDPLATASNYLVFLLGLTLMLLLWKKSSLSKIISYKIWIFFISSLYVFLISLFFSLNVNLSLFVNNIIYIILFFLIFDKYGFDFLIKVIIRCFLLILFMSYIFIFMFPDYGVSIGTHDGAWQGIFTHKNQFGVFLSCFLMFLILARYNHIISKKLFVFYILLVFLALVFSKSSTALAVSVISLFLYYLGRFKYIFYKGLFGSFFAKIFFIYIIYFSIMNGAELYADILGKQTVGYSNRDIIWGLGIAVFLNHIWFGSILDKSFNILDYLSVYFGAMIGTFHNTYIESFATYGIIGGSFFMLPLIYLIFKIDKNNFILFYSILIPLLIYLFMESLFTVKSFVVFLLLVLYISSVFSVGEFKKGNL
ncbi:oligosaccharide repeat unit polymerase [Acinetobacter sp. SwsAc6]|uniref:O-antigen ligase family protein n=1 Tax=Acinetobacter sp. SwsAc6 TaxID=2749439 RepID=UPI0015B8CEC4|nr:O-antigen polymerase [Acinetobacter sp. SwsAc6]NWK74509.1 oligosaccharide repeat unit polymerase [Acinetobacter sp. SwsAc6]